MMRKIRLLSIATLFPNPRMPVHAQFVKQRLDALSKRVDLIVLSPIPWFPGERFVSRYTNRHHIPAQIDTNPYPTYFPKFFSLPLICKPLEGFTLALCVALWLRRHGGRDAIDGLDCHLGFPDGFAGALLHWAFRKPYTVTLRGHDINDLPRYPVRIRQVLFGLRHAVRYFGVARALVDAAVGLGAPAATGFASTNGVDAERFFPMDKPAARVQLGLAPEGRYLLTVCHLVPRKGVDILIRALARLTEAGRDVRLIVVGQGGEEGNCEPELRTLARQLDVDRRIVWAGAVANAELTPYYSAADVFCLASEKEGWPNVILEALACSTPAVATDTWGVPEILPDESLGLLVRPRVAEGFAHRIAEALDRTWGPQVLRGYALQHTWDQTAAKLTEHWHAVLGPEN